jgi:hypothetical protein
MIPAWVLLGGCGREAIEAQPITGRVVLRGRLSDAPLELVPLDGAGAPLGAPRAAETTDEGPAFRLDQATVWYLLRAAAKR